MSTDNPYTQPVQQPPTRSGSNTGVIVAVVLGVGFVLFIMCGGVMVGLLLPAVQSAREAARRMQCQNNMKQLTLAIMNYESAYKSFPPAYTVDSNGNRLHSWRTLILPFVEGQSVYEQIDLTQPWDAPVNQAVADANFSFFSCPSAPLQPGMTTYMAVVDPSGIFEGETAITYRQITDGTANTLLLVETDPANAVHWMDPSDLDMPTFVRSPCTSGHTGGCNCAFADGSIQFLSESTDSQTKTAIVTKAGDETGVMLGY